MVKKIEIKSTIKWSAIITCNKIESDVVNVDDETSDGNSVQELTVEKPNWIHFKNNAESVLGDGDGEIVLEIDENDDILERTAYVCVASTDDSGFIKFIEIKQAGKSGNYNGLPSPSQIDVHDVYYRTSNHHSILNSGDGKSVVDSTLISDTYYYDSSNNVDYGVLHHQDKYSELYSFGSTVAARGKIGSYTINDLFDRTLLTDFIVHKDVNKLTANQFGGCTNLETFPIPTDISIIPDNCFNGCSSLTNLDLGTKIISIGKKAFAGTQIDHIVFPTTLESIGSLAFSGCNKLKDITFSSISGVSLNTFDGVMGTANFGWTDYAFYGGEYDEGKAEQDDGTYTINPTSNSQESSDSCPNKPSSAGWNNGDGWTTTDDDILIANIKDFNPNGPITLKSAYDDLSDFDGYDPIWVKQTMENLYDAAMTKGDLDVEDFNTKSPSVDISCTVYRHHHYYYPDGYNSFGQHIGEPEDIKIIYGYKFEVDVTYVDEDWKDSTASFAGVAQNGTLHIPEGWESNYASVINFLTGSNYNWTVDYYTLSGDCQINVLRSANIEFLSQKGPAIYFDENYDYAEDHTVISGRRMVRAKLPFITNAQVNTVSDTMFVCSKEHEEGTETFEIQAPSWMSARWDANNSKMVVELNDAGKTADCWFSPKSVQEYGKGMRVVYDVLPTLNNLSIEDLKSVYTGTSCTSGLYPDMYLDMRGLSNISYNNARKELTVDVDFETVGTDDKPNTNPYCIYNREEIMVYDKDDINGDIDSSSSYENVDKEKSGILFSYAGLWLTGNNRINILRNGEIVDTLPVTVRTPKHTEYYYNVPRFNASLYGVNSTPSKDSKGNTKPVVVRCTSLCGDPTFYITSSGGGRFTSNDDGTQTYNGGWFSVDAKKVDGITWELSICCLENTESSRFFTIGADNDASKSCSTNKRIIQKRIGEKSDYTFVRGYALGADIPAGWTLSFEIKIVQYSGSK